MNGSISDLSPLAVLTDLYWLELSANDVTSIHALAELQKLWHLGLGENPVTEIPTGPYQSSLVSLHLPGASISDHSALADMSQIEVLNLDGNSITDTSFLHGLSKLRWLFLQSNQISDVSGLAGLPELNELRLTNNVIEDVSAFSSFADRGVLLALGNNNISDISVFNGFTSGYVWLEGNPVSCSALEETRSLSGADIRFDETCVGDDSDSDGVSDANDAFPSDPAASVDSDGDGYPDAWNPGATQEQIDASGLTLDELPNEPWYWRDNDGDGIAASQDADDYVSAYVLVEDFIEDMRTEDPTDLLTDVYVQFETMGGASPIFNSGQLTLEPMGHIESNPPAGFITSQTYSGDTYLYSRVGRSTADGSYNVGVRVGQNALVFHPGLSDGIQGHFRHEYAAEGSDDFALNIAGPNLDMGFTPAVGVLHPVEVRINAATGDARITITDANNPDNVFQYDFNDPRLATGSYRLGFLTHGNPGLGVGYFDSVRIANRSVITGASVLHGVADMTGAFGGAVVENGDTFSVPSSAESWAGFANNDLSIYPFSFEQGGVIEFVASVPSGDAVDVRFRLEYRPWPDVDPPMIPR